MCTYLYSTLLRSILYTTVYIQIYTTVSHFTHWLFVLYVHSTDSMYKMCILAIMRQLTGSWTSPSFLRGQKWSDLDVWMVANVEIDSLLESALTGWITPNFLAFHFSAPAIAVCFTCYVSTLNVDYHALLHTSPMDGNKYNFFLFVFYDDWITSYFII